MATRPKSATAQDRKYLNKSQKHETSPSRKRVTKAKVYKKKKKLDKKTENAEYITKYRKC